MLSINGIHPSSLIVLVLDAEKSRNKHLRAITDNRPKGKEKYIELLVRLHVKIFIL